MTQKICLQPSTQSKLSPTMENLSPTMNFPSGASDNNLKCS